jgi:hypothetical protein
MGSVVAAATMVPVSPARGEDKPGEGTTVPLKKIVLFNAGVGYFEHSGQVENDARVDLKFNVDDINDLLKSMVLEDRGGDRFRR